MPTPNPQQLSLFSDLPEKNKKPLPKAEVARSKERAARVAKDKGLAREALAYYERKKYVLALEKRNFTELIFILGNGKEKWFKAFGHSAVIFEHRIAPMINSKALRKEDKDYNLNVHSKEGVISFKSLKDLGTKLKSVNIYLDRAEDNIFVFKLPFRVSQIEYNEYIGQDQLIVENANKIIVPELIMPKLYDELKKLRDLALSAVRRMDGSLRQTFGAEFESKTRIMVRDYVIASRDNTVDGMEFLKKTLKDLEQVNGDLFSVSGTHIIEDARYERLAVQISNTREQIIAEMRKFEAHRIEKEFRGKMK